MPRVLINGFGRIGRSILRALTTNRTRTGIDVAMINDVADPELLAYLFKYDSVFGPHPGSVALDGTTLTVDGQRFTLAQEQDLAALFLDSIDVILDCTGHVKNRDLAVKGLDAGADRMLISGPCPSADLTLIPGANDDALADQKVISLGSCTTNAIAPLLSIIDGACGLRSAHITTIHCYTASQPTIDTARGSFERSRAAALSMVPTTSSASALVGLVLPKLAGKTTISSVRVPCASVSAIDLVAQCETPASASAINELIRGQSGPIVGTETAPLVSTDLRQRSESIIVACPQTQAIGPQARVFGWYDNEWGFANRMIDTVCQLHG